MCTHGRWITNKYTRSKFFVGCGKCKSCLQEKAASRSARIRNEYDGVTPIYFVTLTYDNLSCPYVYKDDILNLSKLPDGFKKISVYRSSSLKWNGFKKKYVRLYKPELLCDLPIREKDIDYNFTHVKCLNKSKNCVGVCYFQDLQLFIKRFRQHLHRKYNYEGKISYFDCSEYGGKSERPHYHLLIWCNLDQEKVHDSVCASWKYGRRVRYKESCQLVTQDPAGYVASYVNSGSDLSSFHSVYFKPKHSHSKYFGHGLRAFSLEEVSKAVTRGNLEYASVRTIAGVPSVVNLPIPKYVVNRYFPLFKGYSRLTSHQVLEFLSRGFDVCYLHRESQNFDLNNPAVAINYDFPNSKLSDRRSDYNIIFTRLSNAFRTYRRTFPSASFFDYAKAYEMTWRCFRSGVYRRFMEDEEVNPAYKYDNLCFLPKDYRDVVFDRLDPTKRAVHIFDCNMKPHYVSRSRKMSEMYDKYCKQKDVTNFILYANGIPI